MGKRKTKIDLAIERITQDIQALELARMHLVEERDRDQTPRPARPRPVAKAGA